MENRKSKNYVLGMFPYPSGEGLHVGHVRIYTAVDVMARYFRMKGQEVLHTVGWDAFGLPAENAAIKKKTNPMKLVPQYEANFKRQMEKLNFSFDWDRSFSTTDPTYYGITQYIFLKLYNSFDDQGRRLVYREEVPINWCPKCKTGLANEEVLGDGTHERCGTQVEKKLLPQWVMRITSYADRLLEDLDGKYEGLESNGLDWPRGILEMQRNWIGKKEGIRVEFGIKDFEYQKGIEVFTTRLDTIYGVTYMVVAPELVNEWIGQGWRVSEEVKKYTEESLVKTEQMRLEEMGEKTGVKLDIMAVNPINGEEVPVYVSDYVMAGVGTGAVMGVPAHDERDFEFAKKFGIEVRRVVDTGENIKEASEEDGKLINSAKYNGVSSEEARVQILGDLGDKAKSEVNYHLRDWVFSRQRYWGEPIPLVYCDKCGDENGVVSLSERDLPLKLPELESYEPTDTGESPLSRVDEWITTTCPKCGGKARRESDTMPNWAGSCWYFLAFPFWNKSVEGKIEEYKNTTNEPYSKFWEEIVRPELTKWLPVDWYLGGAEHAVLHLLYARFWVKVLQDRGMLDFSEPFLRLRSVGMVHAEDGKKMSKSLGNVVNPDDMVEKYGSDAVRMYEMFMGPWDQSIDWDERALVGQKRFVDRVVSTIEREGKVGDESSKDLRAMLDKLVGQVERGIQSQKFNTSIASIMEFINEWRVDGNSLSNDDVFKFLLILSPFAPELANEMWERLGGDAEIGKREWPKIEEIRELNEIVEVVVQVNGKVRGRLNIDSEDLSDKDKVIKKALNQESVSKWVRGKYRAAIYVEGKLLNIVA